MQICEVSPNLVISRIHMVNHSRIMVRFRLVNSVVR